MNFKVGDRVRIRQWDDMVREYGTNSCGDITGNAFVSGMRHICGRTATITAIDAISVILDDWSDLSGGTQQWSYTFGMLEPAEPIYIEQVAQILGVGMGEEFDIVGDDYNPYRFMSYGLVDCNEDIDPNTLMCLLTERNTIKRAFCTICKGANDLETVDDTTICVQCAKDVLATWVQKQKGTEIAQ